MARTFSHMDSLENKRMIFQEIGLILALGLTLFAFEYKSYKSQDIISLSRAIEDTQEEMIEITQQNKLPPPPTPPEQTTLIQIVDNEIEVEQELEINVEATQETIIEEYIPTDNINDDDDEIEEEKQVFVVVESMPEFPGGETELRKYLGEHITYPNLARESGIQGKVFVSFVVEKDGKVTNIIILRGIGGGCDEEAIKVVQNMPDWIPGKQRGQPVRVQFNLPINFTLR